MLLLARANGPTDTVNYDEPVIERVQLGQDRSLLVDRDRLVPQQLLRHVAGEAARASSVLSGRAQRLAVANLFTRSRHVMAALEAS